MMTNLKAPFAWYGGKSRVSDLVWSRFGNTLNYVEPFFGSGAVLLKRPFPVHTETVNDKDAYLANFWRATQADPEQVAYYADWTVSEADLHARHLWLVNQAEFREQMMTDPEFYDAKIAGWWVWGLSQWIGSGWCDVNRGQTSQRPNLRPKQGIQSVNNNLPNINTGKGVHAKRVQSDIESYMMALRDRLRRVRITCGDWKRITGPSVTYLIGMTGIFLDPPYGDTRQDNLYAVDSLTVADEVREWCIEEIDDKKGFTGPRYLHPKLRIALCGLDGEHNELEALGWGVVPWKANGGYGGQNKKKTNPNKHRERIWFSPNCLNPTDDIMTGVTDNNSYDHLFSNGW